MNFSYRVEGPHGIPENIHYKGWIIWAWWGWNGRRSVLDNDIYPPDAPHCYLCDLPMFHGQAIDTGGGIGNSRCVHWECAHPSSNGVVLDRLSAGWFAMKYGELLPEQDQVTFERESCYNIANGSGRAQWKKAEHRKPIYNDIHLETQCAQGWIGYRDGEYHRHMDEPWRQECRHDLPLITELSSDEEKEKAKQDGLVRMYALIDRLEDSNVH